MQNNAIWLFCCSSVYKDELLIFFLVVVVNNLRKGPHLDAILQQLLDLNAVLL